jgi:carbon storage regulator
MLVLTRKPNETILIGDDIEVRVLNINKGQVSLGIEAPKNVKILRAELTDNDKEEDENRGNR